MRPGYLKRRDDRGLPNRCRHRRQRHGDRHRAIVHRVGRTAANVLHEGRPLVHGRIHGDVLDGSHGIDRYIRLRVLHGIDPVSREIEAALLQRRHFGGVGELRHELAKADENARQDDDRDERLHERHPMAAPAPDITAGGGHRPASTHTPAWSLYQSARPVACVTLMPRQSLTWCRSDVTYSCSVVLAAPSLRNTNAGSGFPLMVTLISEAALSGPVASAAPAHVVLVGGVPKTTPSCSGTPITCSPGSAARLLLTSSTM